MHRTSNRDPIIGAIACIPRSVAIQSPKSKVQPKFVGGFQIGGVQHACRSHGHELVARIGHLWSCGGTLRARSGHVVARCVHVVGMWWHVVGTTRHVVARRSILWHTANTPRDINIAGTLLHITAQCGQASPLARHEHLTSPLKGCSTTT